MPLANITQLEPFNINSSASFTFANITSTGNVTSTYFIGNGSQLTGISAGSTYSNANVAAYLPTFSGNSAAGNFIGNGYFLTSINASNIAGQVANALVAGTVYTNAQPNITSVGSLASLTVTGLVTATAGGIKVGNLQDTSGTNTVQLTNSDILVTGNISAGAGGAGNVTATYFIGNGSQLTGLPASYSNANVAAYLPTFSGNIGANFITATGNVTAGNLVTSGSGGNLSGANYVIANYFVGDGSALTSITGANVTGTVANATYATSAGTATTAGTVTTAAQPNITSTGTLAGVAATGTINLTSASNVSLGPVANVHITGGTSGQYLKTDGSGALSWADAGNATAIINGTSNVVVSADSNVTMGISGNAAIFTATGTGVNISGYLTATGNVTAGNLVTSGSGGNLSGANYVIANYFVGDGSQLTGLPAGYANSNVAAYLPTYSGLIGGTLSTTSQPNITSVGTLSDLSVSGNATVTGNLTVGGNVNYINVDTLVIEDPIIEQGGGANGAPLTTNDGKDRGSLLHYYTTAPVDAFMGWDNSNGEFAFGSNVSVSSEVVTFNTLGNVRASTFIGSLSGAATTAATVTTNAQPNITSVGTLTSLSVTGNVTASYLIGNGSQLTGLPASYSNANVAAYLPTYTGELSVANITSTGNITASYLIGNGSQLTGLPASYANANVANYLPTYTGNFSPSNLVVSTSANLGAVGNVIITGGTSGQVLSTDGSGVLSWADQSGGGGGPATPVAGVQVFTADGSGNTYTLSSTPANEDQLTVNIDGVMQLHSSFSLSGNVVTLGGTPTNGAKVEITNISATAGVTTGKAIAMAIVFGF